ncbi:MAG: histidine phosphatase family protein [Thioalkalivibrio sp.]|nr:histidine phosphatase family protein [Thioalkalivibrio sp.]
MVGQIRVRTLAVLLWLGIVLASSPLAAGAAEVLADLSEPGTVLLLRHALAPGTGDPPGFVLGDCSTQRNLSDTGREQARQLGERLRQAGIVQARVYSSRWCRCLETAELLGLGPVQPLPALDSFFQERSQGAARTRAARDFLRDLPVGPPVILVTHQVNITGLTGQFTASGSGVLARVPAPGDGDLEVLGVLR